MILRPYQEKCINTILSKINQGVRKQIIVLATGTGKTTIFSHLPQYVKKSGKKTLILAHRDELLVQAKNEIHKISPELVVEIEQGGLVSSNNADVIVASVATLGRAGSGRIAKFNPKDFGLIIIDEVHHGVANTYQNILSYFGANKQDNNIDKGPVLLGVTATPNRKDNLGLDLIFDELVFKYDIKDGIENKYLANIKAYTIFTKEDLSSVHMSMGDFQVGELADAINTEHRNKIIIDSYKKICDGETALVFAADVAHSEELSKLFVQEGYTSKSVSGNTPTEERRQILNDFETGKIQVVVNCMILTEGYNNPNIKAVLFARPTTSNSLYIQMAGRGTRIAPGKDHVKFLDFVDNMSKHSIISSSTLIGLDKPIKANGEFIMDFKDKFDELLSNSPNENISDINLDEIDARIQEVDIFKMAQLPEFITRVSKYAWTPFLEGFKISLGKSEDGTQIGAVIRENMLGQYETQFIKIIPQVPSFKNNFKKSKIEELHSFTSSDRTSAIEQSDVYIFEKYKQNSGLVRQDAVWRQDSPSEKQIKLLKKFGFANAEKLSKGEACNLLSKYFADKDARKNKTNK